MYRKISKNEIKLDKTLGYLYFIDKDHPLASSVGKVYQHRHVASLNEGRWLSSEDQVHHLDGNKRNNDPDNLKILSRSEHAALHKPSDPKVMECDCCGKTFEVHDTRRKMKSRVYCTQRCWQKSREVIKWPSVAELKLKVEASNYSVVARELGVSDNAIRKRIKKYS